MVCFVRLAADVHVVWLITIKIISWWDTNWRVLTTYHRSSVAWIYDLHCFQSHTEMWPFEVELTTCRLSKWNWDEEPARLEHSLTLFHHHSYFLIGLWAAHKAVYSALVYDHVKVISIIIKTCAVHHCKFQLRPPLLVSCYHSGDAVLRNVHTMDFSIAINIVHLLRQYGVSTADIEYLKCRYIRHVVIFSCVESWS